MNSIDEELSEAARVNNLPEVRRLLSVGADVNAKDGSDWTPLHIASNRGHVQVAKELVDHGAGIEATDNFGWTALHFACYKGHPAVVKELLDHGAEIDVEDIDGETPLYCACYNDHLPVVKTLRAVGANILSANNQGERPIHVALRRRHSEVSKYLLGEFYATVRHLPLHELLKDLTRIGNPNSRSDPPLRVALDANVLGTVDVVEIVEFLVARDPAVLRSRNQDGSLSLHVACRLGASFAIVQSLVNRYKASVKSVTSEGDLPLFLACESPEPSLDTIFLLMKLYPDLVYR
jgi:ankyrin repeat protein